MLRHHCLKNIFFNPICITCPLKKSLKKEKWPELKQPSPVKKYFKTFAILNEHYS